MLFRNKLTGQTFSKMGNCSEYRLKMGIRAMDRIKLELGLEYYFNTITLSDKNIDICNKNLDRYHNFMRQRFIRAGLPFKLLWVREIQIRRYYKYGKQYPHWHEIYLCPSGSFPNTLFRKDIKPHYKVIEDGSVISQLDLHNKWGFGQNFCERAYTNDLWAYLEKYLSKEFYEGKKSRLMGMSNFDYYKCSKSVYDKIIEQEQIYGDNMIVKRKQGKVLIYGLNDKTYLMDTIRISSDWELIAW